MTKTIYWTYGLSGVEVKKMFPKTMDTIIEHDNITYVRETDLGEFRYRYAVLDEVAERRYFIERIVEGYTPIYITGADNYVGSI